MRRLCECRCIDAAELLYAIPVAGEVSAVFDGDRMLEAAEHPLIDEITRRIKLRQPPTGPVRCLLDDSADTLRTLLLELDRLRGLLQALTVMPRPSLPCEHGERRAEKQEAVVP